MEAIRNKILDEILEYCEDMSLPYEDTIEQKGFIVMWDEKEIEIDFIVSQEIISPIYDEYDYTLEEIKVHPILNENCIPLTNVTDKLNWLLSEEIGQILTW